MNKILNYPIEIVEKMLFYQVSQGNPLDVEVFKQLGPDTNAKLGGFNWSTTPEGTSFWSEIINKRNFNNFYKRYPEIKRSGKKITEEIEEEIEEEVEELYVGTQIVVNHNGKNTVRRLLSYNKDFPNPVIAITENAYQALLQGDDSYRIEIKSYPSYDLYKEEVIVELTLEDISNGKGVGVPPHLIKIIK